MLDRFNRKINYLRVSVTDRCNQRCYYCMPNGCTNLTSHDDILSFEEIVDVIKIGVAYGINKVRLTGGEPLVKRDIISLVLMISQISGIKDLSMTTNGVLLEKYALPLRQAGLQRINVSLDTLDPVRYEEITKFPNLEKVLEGLEKAKHVGFSKIKLNCVISSEEDRHEGQSVQEYADKNGFELRLIRKMDISKGEFWQVEGGDGGNCQACNRLRLSSDGKLFPCLFSDHCYSVREYGIEKAFIMALENKPESGSRADNKFNFMGG